MNLTFHQVVDPATKLITWILILVAWTCLLTSDDYHKYTFSPYSPTLLLNCTFWAYLSLWLILATYMFLKDRSIIGSDILFGANFTGTLIFGVLIFANAIQWFGWGTFDRSDSKELKIKVTNIFMLFGGTVAILDAGFQVLRRFRV